MPEATKSPSAVRTDIPFRLDRLPWSRFHLLVVIGLGITWILDGLEVTIVGSLGPALQSAQTLSLSSANLGAIASFYVVGAVIGALVFGWITDLSKTLPHPAGSTSNAHTISTGALTTAVGQLA
jgi:MFS family permease